MSKKDDFFVGWAAKPPVLDRRFFIGSGIVGLAAAGGLASVLASRQDAVGPGTWDQGTILTWRGKITSDPYPMLRTRDTDGTIKTALLGCMGKCAVRPRIDAMGTQTVEVQGSAIRRGAHLMIATQDDGSWISQAEADEPGDLDLAFPAAKRFGTIDLKGMIVDSKCWFGAMRPGEGKVHKACAALCIRGGLPPAFLVRSMRGEEELLIITDEDGGPVRDDILPYVADPLRLVGEAHKLGEMFFVRTGISAMTRL